MSNAIESAIEELKDKYGSKVIVIVTDGMPNSPEKTVKAAKQAKDKGIDIITIGTDDANEEFLKRLASRDELNIMVSRDQLAKSISSSVKMFPRSTRGKLSFWQAIKRAYRRLAKKYHPDKYGLKKRRKNERA